MFTILQFFNPGAFAPVNTFPQGLPGAGPNATEPQDDAVSYCYYRCEEWEDEVLSEE